MIEQNSPQPNLSTLRTLMIDYFKIGELKALCMDLNIDFENVSGQGKSEIVIGIIEHLQRRNRLQELMEKLRKLRPNGNWDTVYQTDLAEEKSDEPAQPDSANLKTGNAPSKRRTVGVSGLILLVLIAAAVWLIIQTGIFCPYHAATDNETIIQIIKIESQAVKEGNLAIIEDIFAADAYLKQTEKESGQVTEWFDPLSHYSALFENTRFLTAVHNNISGRVDGRSAHFTSGGQGSYTKNGVYGEYDNKAGDPNQEEVWTLQKNLCGCWQITKFEFH
jgi:hypothetical protein